MGIQRGEYHVNTEAEIRKTELQTKEAKIFSNHQELGRGKKDSPLEYSV